MNLFKTTMLLTGLTVLLVLVGSAIGGKGGMIIALGFAVVMNFGSYWYSDKLVLKMHGARRVSEADAPQLYGIVRELSQRAKLPMPAVYIMASDTPNAFATGRNPEHAAVAATQGLLRIMNREELRGVLAHELAHVRHRDILIGSIAATFAGAIAMLANIAQFSMIFGGGRDNNNGGLIGSLAMIFLAPLAASLIQMAVSRSREYAADAGGAEISGDAMGLASALRKLEQGNHAHPMESAERNPSTAHMFIVNPLFGGKFGKLFSTHPDTAERIRRLEAIARGV